LTMGFDVGGFLKTVTDPGSIVNDLAHKFLPKDLQFLGGVAGAFVDYEMGNPVGAMQEGMSSLNDLSQNNLSSGKPSGSPGAPTFPWKAEPPPPMFLATQSFAAAPPAAPAPASEGLSGAWHLGGGAPAGAPPAASETKPAARPTVSPHLVFAAATPAASWTRPGLFVPKSIAEGLPPQPAPSAWRGTPPPTRPTTPSETAASAGPSSPAQTPSTPKASDASSTAPGTTTPPATPPPATRPSSTTPSSTTPASTTPSPNTPSSTAPSSTGGQAVSDAAKAFINQGNDPLMNAVRDGAIPSAVSDSPAAMMALQARMNHISEMNQLMTSMMQALHQMQMSIIQNVRV
jgi:hypothetical protein